MLTHLWQRQHSRMIGIDIGSHEIKAIVIGKAANEYKVIHYACVPMIREPHNNQDIHDFSTLVDSLKQLAKFLPKNLKYAAIAVSGSAVMTKRIFVDASLSEDEMEAQIEIEASNLIPYPLEEVSLDFEIIATNRTDPLKIDVLLSACRTENIDILVDALEAINLEAKIVDIEGYALGGATQLIFKQLPDANKKSICMVDIGAKKTTFTFLNAGETTLICEQDMGAEQLTQSIQSYYTMTREDAEAAKLNPQQLPDNYNSDLLQGFQQQLVQQIKRTLQMYSGSTPCEYIFLCGGAAKLSGLDSLLTHEIGLEAVVANPFQGGLVASEEHEIKLTPIISKYMVACGLALRTYG